ncbi:MAG: hypothetical protein P8O04_03805 [Flavobacteriaceae bacterium]|nr:hypothetical protein [Flavobacteriaceae bacterium]
MLIYGSVSWAQLRKTVDISFIHGLETALPPVELTLQNGVIQKILTKEKKYTLYLTSDFSEGVLEVGCVGYSSLQIPIRFGKKQNHIDLGSWSLQPEEPEELRLPIVSLADWEAQQTVADREQLGWVLQAQRDPFLTAAAFQFSSAFFRLRGLDTSHQSIRINGIPMNNPVSQRPNWSQWGGLNDFTNAAALQYYGLEPSDFDMGGALGSIHWELKPSSLRQGTKFSQAFSNANYRYRTMFSQVGYEKDWNYGLLLSMRQGEEGYQEGTSYRAYSLAALLERQWNAQHQSWIAFVYTPSRRGRSAPLTQEVFDLKGRRYNPYWGWYKGKKRNARTKETQAPQLFLSHLFQPQENTQWRLNYSLAWVRVGQTRIFHHGSWIEGGALVGGGFNPDPVYYQKLPSYFLREPSHLDYEKNYWARERLLNDGQLNWERFYQSNVEQTAAIYALLSDEEVALQNSFSLQFQKKLSPLWRFSSEWLSQLSQTRFSARPTSLLGASLVYNLYPYAQTISEAPHNLLASDAAVEKGEAFGYDYALQLLGHQWNARVFMEKPGLVLFLAAQMGYQSHFRQGYFQNGRYPETSYGKGAKQHLWSSHWKAALTYSLSGLHHFNLRLGYQSLPPSLGAQYLNPRERHFVNPFTANENILALEAKYQLTTEQWRAQFTSYFIDHQKGHRQGFYYADGIRGQKAFFVQEHLNNIHQTRLGIEFAGRYQPLEEVSIDWGMALGRFRYQNNPQLLQLTDPSPESEQAGFRNGWQDFGLSYLKGYPIARGLQQAFSLGFTYNDPKYWRMGFTFNHFRKAYVAANAFRRTQNFYQDFDGHVFVDYNPQQANALLEPEELPSHSTLNLIGSKSWKWGKQYFGFFISLQNVLNTHYKTGGFEQARNANYRTLVADQARTKPLFASKYWWGRGITFFTSIYYRFP